MKWLHKAYKKKDKNDERVAARKMVKAFNSFFFPFSIFFSIQHRYFGCKAIPNSKQIGKVKSETAQITQTDANIIL